MRTLLRLTAFAALVFLIFVTLKDVVKNTPDRDVVNSRATNGGKVVHVEGVQATIGR